MAKIKITLKALRKKHAKGLERAFKESIYGAYTRYNQKGYHRIISTAPKSRTANERWPIGFVSSHIKLVVKRRPPYTYQEVDVPGKHSKGGRAWRAWVVLKTLHDGWTKLPFERTPTRKKALSFPVISGSSVPRKGSNRVTVKKAVQVKQIKKNPWIRRVWESLEPEFEGMLEVEVEKQKKRKRTKRIV